MITSKSFWLVKKEDVSQEENFINKILIKSGYIYKNASGIYTYLPLGVKLIENICKIINEECKKIDASKLSFPSLVPTNVFDLCDRNELLGKSLYNVIDRNNKSYTLCPTHEELFAEIVKMKVKSYKDLHFILYQISNKYRDEEKTNKGLIRKKEFLMFDAYSFDTDESGLDISYDNMYHVFKKIFRKLGLDTVVCTSDPGTMHAYLSEEFHVIGPYGEDDIAKCTKCSFISNIDIAEVKPEPKHKDKKIEKLKKVYAPNLKTIKDISDFFDVKEHQVLKTLIYKVNNRYKMILLRGNDEINNAKLYRAFGTANFSLATEDELKRIGSTPGYVGPLKSTMEIIADSAVKYMSNFITGSNEKNYYYQNVNIPFDFKVSRYMDLKQFDENTKCPKCGSEIEMLKGLEIGNIFKIGMAFTKKIDASYTNEKNKKNYIHMGSYGIGIDRCIYALAEKYHDNKGLTLPLSIAPYKISIVIANVNDKESKKYAENLYNKFMNDNIDTILDDRKETLGVKLNDMELIGVPIIIIVGKSLNMNKVEIKIRTTDKKILIDKNRIYNNIKETIKKLNLS